MYVSAKKMKTEKVYERRQSTQIISIICALFNSNGGKLNIDFEGVISPHDTDNIVRQIEQRLMDITELSVFATKVRMLKINAKQLVFSIDSLQALCTVNYNLYFPTEMQIHPFSPQEPPESIKAFLNREIDNHNQFENYEDFIIHRQLPFQESNSIQFRHFKSESLKQKSVADQITNKSNKLESYISAFANKNGGCMFYGITYDGVVRGQVIESQDKIARKVTKAIHKMIWSRGELERGRHWDIQFAPVKDESQNEIPFLFVVFISVVPLRGGLFTSEPESYHVVQSEVERMPYTEWRRRFFADEQSSAAMNKVPSVVGGLNSVGGYETTQSIGKLKFIILLKI